MDILKNIFTICSLFISIGSAQPQISTVTNQTNSVESTVSGRTDCINPQDCLYKDLFSRYNKDIKPVINPKDVVNCTVTLVVNSLIDIQEKDEVMVIVGFLRTIWHDQFLRWDPSKYSGVDHLIIPADRIWLPDIAVSNSASQFYDITHKRDFHVEIESDGKVRWAFGGIFKSNCDIQLENYPFDSQICDIEIENWMYTIEDVDLFFTEGNEIAVTGLDPNAVWFYFDSETSRSIKYKSFASLKFTLIWKRKTLYYYVNIVIPIILMLLIAMGVFWLPAECGEKMSLAISVVLAFSVFQIIIMENTPVNSDVVPNITALVMLVTVTATTSLLTSMIVVYISGKSTNTRPPAWLRTLCYKYLSIILCIKKSIPEQDGESTISKPQKETISMSNGFYKVSKRSISPEANDMSVLQNREHTSIFDDSKKDVCHLEERTYPQMTEMVEYLRKINNLMQNTESNNFIRDEWRYVGMVVDRCAFWITVTVLVASLAFIWS